MRTWTALLAVTVTGCSDLAKLETEQAALEEEVAVLRDNVEQMRTQMQRAGMIKSGPVPTAPAVEAPEDDLSSKLPWSAAREGRPPALDLGSGAERREKTDCGYRMDLPWLEPLSDFTLAKGGTGRASPVRLSIDGIPLKAHAGPPMFEKQCAGAFRHQARYLFFSPSGSPDAVGELALTLAAEVPLSREDGEPMYWVYPGTTLTFSFEDGWSDAWGTFGVDADARLINVGSPGDPNPAPGGEATIEVLGASDAAAANKLGLSATPDAPSGPWTITVSSPSDGPYVVLNTLRVGNAEKGLMVVGESP